MYRPDQPFRAIDGATLVDDLEESYPDVASLLFGGLVAIAERLRAAGADGVVAAALIDPRSRTTRTAERIARVRARTGLPAVAPPFSFYVTVQPDPEPPLSPLEERAMDGDR